jgi:hypothetical protein
MMQHSHTYLKDKMLERSEYWLQMKAAKFLFLFLVNAEANNLEKLVASKQGFIFQEIKLEELHEKNF